MDSFDTATDAAALDAELMAFAARRRQQREALEAKADAEAAAAPTGADGFVEFIEVVRAPVDGAVKVEVDVVDAAAPGGAAGAAAAPADAAASASNPLGVERSDYAVRRVDELSVQLAQLSQVEAFVVTDELRREAEEARKINISAQESAKKAREGAAAKPGAKKPGATVKVTHTGAP